MTQRPKGTGSIYQRKDGMWIGTIEAGWTIRGTRRRITISATTKQRAKQKLQAKQLEIAQKGLPDEGTRATTTLKNYAENWLTTQQHVSASTYRNAKTSVNRWIIPTIGHKRLTALSARDIRSVTTAITQAGRKLSTAQRTYSVLMTLLHAAVEDGHTIPQSALNTPNPGRNATDRTAIPIDEIKTILHAAAHHPNAPLFYLSFLQGMRPAEVRGLTWNAIDTQRMVIDVSWQLQALPPSEDGGYRIPQRSEARHLYKGWFLTRPKTSAGRRIIPLIPQIALMLEQWKQTRTPNKYDLVFTSPAGGVLDDKKHRQQWYDLCDTAQVACVDEDGNGRRYDLYEARHSCASLLKHLRVPDEVIIRIMGHSSINSTQAYIHVPVEDARRALEDVAALLTSQ